MTHRGYKTLHNLPGGLPLTKQAHTPGPVKLAPRNHKRLVSVCRSHPSDRRAVPLTVAVCESEADAARLALCWNMHDELVKFVREQHRAIDALLARVIELDSAFMPTKWKHWPTVALHNEVIAKAERSAP